jgi:hypothetical protein
VNCEVCGTELPQGAMFCGECGRSVAGRTVTTHPDSGMPLAPQPPTAVIAPPAPAPGDTRIIDPFDVDALPPISAPAAQEDPEIEQDLPPEVVEEEDVESVLEPEAAAEEEPVPATEPDLEPEPEPEPEPTPALKPAPESVQLAPLASAPAPMRRPDPFPWGDRGGAIFSDSDELEQTLIVPRRNNGERFVLQFSTGESVTVFGTGLLGRNPQPQPGEYFDQLVVITDPGKSVSKTHLEFGQDSGSFWVSDRYSGNGSVVREPEMPARRLEPGKRYRIVRGSRVDIGEQFFVVS